MTWLIHICDLIFQGAHYRDMPYSTHSYMWHVSFIYVTCFVHICHMSHSYTCPDISGNLLIVGTPQVCCVFCEILFLLLLLTNSKDMYIVCFALSFSFFLACLRTPTLKPETSQTHTCIVSIAWSFSFFLLCSWTPNIRMLYLLHSPFC